jgi:hypothetical protein
MSPPIMYGVDESTPEAAAAVDVLVRLLSDVSENRASAHDLISLSMAAAGYFLRLPVADLEENLSLDSITCILYRVSYLRMFTAYTHGCQLTLLPGEVVKLAELQAAAAASKARQDAALPGLQNIARLHWQMHHPPAVRVRVAAAEHRPIPGPESADDMDVASVCAAEGESDARDEEEGAAGVDVTPEYPDDDAKANAGNTAIASTEPAVEPSPAAGSGSGSAAEPPPAEGEADGSVAEAEEEGEAEPVPTPAESLQLLQQAVADMVASGRAEETAAHFMDHFLVMLGGLRDMRGILDGRRAEVEENTLLQSYHTASNHAFIAQKTLNYLQF